MVVFLLAWLFAAVVLVVWNAVSWLRSGSGSLTATALTWLFAAAVGSVTAWWVTA
jgi:hypothetical protein